MTVVETVMSLTGGDECKVAVYVELAEGDVLNARFPYGKYTEQQKEETLEMYKTTVIKQAVVLFAKEGAEGESSHSENGVSRVYSDISQSPLADVVPMVDTIY